MTRALLITRREILEVLRDLNLLGPMIMLPALMAVILSLAMVGTATVDTGTVTVVVGSIGTERLPPRWTAYFLGLAESDQEKLLGDVLKALMLPLFWIVTVALTATVASDSFVGEKERDTLEPLLATPIKNAELFFGKLLTAVIPATVGTWLGVAIFAVGVWRADNPYFPRFLFADPDWVASSLFIVPLMAVMAAGVAALISTKVSTYRAAYQLNSLVALPIITLLIPQTMILFFLTKWALFVLGGFFLVIDTLLILTAVHFFDREQLLKGR